MGVYSQKLADRLLAIPYIRSAMNEKAVLETMMGASKVRIYIGIGLMCFSYVICWPFIGLLGMLSFQTKSPWLISIGGPLLYGFSHLMFLTGVYLAGMQHAKRMARQATRKLILKLQGALVPSPE